MKTATGCYMLLIFVLWVGFSAFAAYPVGDLNENNIVDFDDLVLFADQWMQYPDCFGAPGCPDLEGDDGVDIDDFAILAQNWLQRGQITLVINEIMASNSTLEDPQEPGEYPDWIEIYNYGTQAIIMTGMYLQDNNNLWQIPPGVSIEAGQHLLFWADDDVSQGIFHTNFKLDKSGDLVTLFEVDGLTIIDTVSFSDQETDISYGRYPDAAEDWYLMNSPTPYQANNAGLAGEVYFSRLGGTFTSNFSLTLSAVSPTAQIRYTTDGSIPTQSSNLYSSPITINNSQASRIIARTYDSPLAPGAVRMEYYIPLAADVQNFSSNLPILVFDSFGVNIDENGGAGCWNFTYPLQSNAVVFIDADKTGQARITDLADFAGRGGMHIRGESSRCWPKRQYSLEIWDETGQDRDVSLLGLPADSDWVLNAPYGDKTLIRNILAYKWSNDIMSGWAAPGTRLVEVFYNQNGGDCAAADYRGVYVLMEKIKIDKNRVDIAKLDAGDVAEPDITGGYMLRVDKYNGQERFWTAANMTAGGDGIQYYDPDGFGLTATQKSWIQSWLNTFESNLNSSIFNDPSTGYAQYIDVENFIEYDVILEIFKNADGFKLSTYFHKDRNGKLHFGPQWDFNFSSGNATNSGWYYPTYFAKASTTEEGWFCDNFTGYGWHSRLLQDPDYKIRYADKWFEHREDKLSDAQVESDIDYYYNLLDSDGLINTQSTPADRNFAKWNILSTWVECNYYIGGTYPNEINWLKGWFYGYPNNAKGDYTNRLQWIDDLWVSSRNICTPPTLSVNGTPMNQGGQVSVGSSLTMSAACSGTIYYTTDGTDPRTWTTSTGSVPPFNIVLAAESADKKVLVPAAAVSDNWKGGSAFDDSAWNNYTFVAGKSGGVGYERSNGNEYDGFISYDVESYLYNNNNTQSCLVRIPFSVDAGQLADVSYLTLRARYDDAFVAYINGTEVCRSAYVPTTLGWNSKATQNNPTEATGLVSFDISTFLGLLHTGSNILAIHSLNNDKTSSDFLISAQLEAGAVGSDGLTPGGAISPSAIQYTGQINLTRSEHITARVKNGSNWGALNKAGFSVGPVADNLRITEIMYHPADPNHEFIEVQNIGTSVINLAWVQFTDGIEFTFPNLTLGAGQFAVVVRDQAAFIAQYGTGITIAGQFTGALDNSGEEIVLRDAFGTEILDFDYNDKWYPVTDGAGFSLNIINPSNPDRSSWDDKNVWQAGSVPNGSPGAANPANAVPHGAVVINEIRTHSDSAPGDWIELYNTTAAAVNISGWFLSDDPGNLKKYRIAEGQSIPAYGYKVFTQDANFGTSAPDPGRLVGFGFSELGEQVYLSSGSGGNLAGGCSIWEEFEAAPLNVSFGRHVKSAMANYDVDFVLMQNLTYGAANSQPRNEGIVIQEIMYNPSVTHDQLGEYIELKNTTGFAINLYDASNPSNTWKFTRGIDYTFPTGVSVPADGIILVVRTTPAIFRTLNPGVPAGVGIYGPFVNSELANDGQKIELSRPGTPEPGGFVPYIRVEQVNYSDGTHPVGNDPWPLSADGEGQSLHRISTAGYSNDVSNWTAADPTPGL